MVSTYTSADISKMKVADLKKELKARGLSTVGTKPELVGRLVAAGSHPAQDSSMSDDGNAESEILDEDEVLDDVEGEEFDDDDLVAEAALADEPKPKPAQAVKRPAPVPAATQQPAQQAPKKRVLIRPSHSVEKENDGQTKDEEMEEDRILNNSASEEGGGTGRKVIKLSAISVKERLELRAQKFGTPLSVDAKKQARAERFGIASNASSNTKSGKISLSGINTSDEVLKKRAERFGVNVSTKAIKIEMDEKKKQRMEKFGVNATATATNLTATATNLDEKKKLRAERFKIQ